MIRWVASGTAASCGSGSYASDIRCCPNEVSARLPPPDRLREEANATIRAVIAIAAEGATGGGANGVRARPDSCRWCRWH